MANNINMSNFNFNVNMNMNMDTVTANNMAYNFNMGSTNNNTTTSTTWYDMPSQAQNMPYNPHFNYMAKYPQYSYSAISQPQGAYPIDPGNNRVQVTVRVARKHVYKRRQRKTQNRPVQKVQQSKVAESPACGSPEEAVLVVAEEQPVEHRCHPELPPLIVQEGSQPQEPLTHFKLGAKDEMLSQMNRQPSW